MFATHYHELTDLADATPGVVNFHVAAREWKDDIVFLRKIVPGRSDRSYGIQVARLAGLPHAVIDRAREILGGPRARRAAPGAAARRSAEPRPIHSGNSGCFKPSRPTIGCAQRLSALDVDRMTPIEALALLADLKREARG